MDLTNLPRPSPFGNPLTGGRFSFMVPVMEIRDPIHGSIDLIPPEVAVVESTAYQRLRLIKQLGFAEFSFPGATHNRFLHSLGVCHLSGLAFDSIFSGYRFEKQEIRWRLRQCVRLAALLHDIGHGPLSHTTEEAMPRARELEIPLEGFLRGNEERQADHEDYTIKILVDSELSDIIRENFQEISPLHVACLINKELKAPDDFFIDQGINLRTVLSQIVSSEMDVDRMDYLGRDAFFCGTSYGNIEREWLMQNLTYHIVDGEMHLALDRRALYTFDDFLISRHHMYLIVYFHHKSIIYEELLQKYMSSEDCSYQIPASISDYMNYTDSHLYEHLAGCENSSARRIAERRPYRMVFETHVDKETSRVKSMHDILEGEGIGAIHSSSKIRLSKYHGENAVDQAFKIYVVDQYDHLAKPTTLTETTEIFRRYERARIIERIYVQPEKYQQAKKLILDRQL